MISPILLVDDDLTYRERLAVALRNRGHDVATVGDADTAVSMAKTLQPEGIVLDLRMPGPSGVAVIASLHSVSPSARIVILTGYGSIATALEAGQLGAAGYLTKPADADQILAALEGLRITEEPRSSVPSLDRVEWEHIQRVLSECDGNISKAARILGLHRRSLQRKLEKFPPDR